MIVCAIGPSSRIHDTLATIVVVTSGYETVTMESPERVLISNITSSSGFWGCEDAGVLRPPDDITQHPMFREGIRADGMRRFRGRAFCRAKKMRGYQSQRWA